MGEVKLFDRSMMPQLVRLMRAIESEARPDESHAVAEAESSLTQSARHFDFLSSDSHWFLGASEGETCIGYASIVRVPKVDSRLGYLLIDEIYVLAAHRRQGHGLALMNATLRLATNLGYHVVRLLVRPENAAAQSLYTRLGFQRIDSELLEKVIA